MGLAMYASTEPLPKKAVHFFDIGAVKVVHFKNSDKCEHSLTLRVALSWLRLIRDTLVVRTLLTVSV